jgi:hypothetical protein
MPGTTIPFPNTPSCRGAQLKKTHKIYLYFVKYGKCDKVRRTLNSLLLETLVMVDTFLSDYNGKDRIINLFRVKTMRLFQVEERYEV